MINESKVIGVVTARGGSKGLPGKNIRPINGKPLIYWTISEAICSKYIDRLIVSTDDREIADISINCGAQVPFIRPDELACDNAKSIDVVLHAIDFFEKNNENYDIFVLLEPTAPLRTSNDIDLAIEKLVGTKDAESVVALCKVENCHPDFLVQINNGFINRENQTSIASVRRQDLSTLYFFTGNYYISFVSSLKIRKSFYHDKTIANVLPKWKSFEIDDICDFKIVETLLRERENGGFSDELQ